MKTMTKSKKKQISFEEALKKIRHAMYDRDTADAVLDKIRIILKEAGFDWQIDD